MQEEIDDNFEIKDLVDVLGENYDNDNKTGIIIRIPKNFDKNLYDFSFILPNYYNSYYDTQISYDDLKFIVPINKYKDIYLYNIISPIIPLFQVNPYEYISENDENKFFYILICNF